MGRHFGAIANAGPSHVQSMCAIGIELQRLGHQFTLLGAASQARRAAQYGIPVHEFTACDPCLAYTAAVREKPNGFLGAVITYMNKMTALLCEEAPGAFKERGIEFLLADQEEPGAATAADLSHLPYVTICSSIPLNEDPWVPPSFAAWGPGRDFPTIFKITPCTGFATWRWRA